MGTLKQFQKEESGVKNLTQTQVSFLIVFDVLKEFLRKLLEFHCSVLLYVNGIIYCFQPLLISFLIWTFLEAILSVIFRFERFSFSFKRTFTIVMNKYI